MTERTQHYHARATARAPAHAISSARNLTPADFALSVTLSARALVESLETAGTKQAGHSSACTWYDTRPLLDPREHCNEVLDIWQEWLTFGHTFNVLAQHPQQPHLVRVQECWQGTVFGCEGSVRACCEAANLMSSL